VERFCNKYQLNYSAEKIIYNEFSVRTYLTLLKSFLEELPSVDTALINLDNLLLQTTNLSITQIQQLNYLDYFLLLTKIRGISIGGTIFLQFENDTHIRIEINLNDIETELVNKQLQELLSPVDIENCKIIFCLPSIHDISFCENQNNSSIYTFFISQIILKNTVIDLKKYNNYEREKIVQNLPVKITAEIINRVQNIINILNSFNLFRNINNDKLQHTLPYTLNTQNISLVFKLLFNNNLEIMYSNLFTLIKFGNFNGSYLMDITPGEFVFFTKKFEELNSAKENSSELDIDNPSNEAMPPNTGFDMA